MDTYKLNDMLIDAMFAEFMESDEDLNYEFDEISGFPLV